MYASLPQLGYMPHIAMALLAPPGQAMLFARFGSLLMGIVAVFFAYLIGRALFPKRFLALALPFAVAFHPQFVFASAYSNNDSTAAALSAAAVYIMIQMIERGLTARLSCALGFVFGCMALSKYSACAPLMVFPNFQPPMGFPPHWDRLPLRHAVHCPHGVMAPTSTRSPIS